MPPATPPPLTALHLLGWIVAMLLLQVAAGVTWSIWRRGRVAADSKSPPGPIPIVRAAAAWQGWRSFRVARREYEDPSGSQCSFYLQPVDGQPLPAFRPGQFLTFSLDIPAALGASGERERTITRCYSLSDCPDPAHYRITVKRVLPPADRPDCQPGLASSFVHDHVQVGHVLRARAPGGHFCIDAATDAPVVFVAGGIGVTPIISMLRWCAANQPQRKVHLYLGVRNGREHAFRALLEGIAEANPCIRLHVVYSRPGDADRPGVDYQHRGHVDVELLQRTLPHGRCQFYVCGPPAMMKTLVPALVDWGVPVADLHYEAFGPASIDLPGAQRALALSDRELEVRFLRSGRTLVWDGTDGSLLEFAERHGVRVESGCRSGGCGSCETRVVEGEVDYSRAPDHEIAPGHCLLCVGRPSTSLVLEA